MVGPVMLNNPLCLMIVSASQLQNIWSIFWLCCVTKQSVLPSQLTGCRAVTLRSSKQMPAGKVVTLSNEILSGLKQNLSIKAAKKLSIKFISHLSGCAKTLLRRSLSGLRWNWRRICLIQHFVPSFVGPGFSAQWQHLLQQNELVFFYHVL